MQIDFDKEFNEFKKQIHPDNKKFGIDIWGIIYCFDKQLATHKELKDIIKSCEKTLQHYKNERLSKNKVEEINEKYKII